MEDDATYRSQWSMLPPPPMMLKEAMATTTIEKEKATDTITQGSQECFPVRCITCGKVFGFGVAYKRLRNEYGEDLALNRLGLYRPCCRTAMKTNVDTIEARHDFERADSLRAPDFSFDRYVTVRTPANQTGPRKPNILYAK